MIVLTENAQVYRGNEPGAKLLPGSINYVSSRNKEWLLLPRYNAWVHQQHVKPLAAALESLTKGIELEPSATLHHYRGIVYSELGKQEEALADFAAAVKLGLASSGLYLNRGLAWQRSSQAENAMADFTAAIDLDPRSDQAWFNRGVLYVELGNLSKAKADFDQAIKVNPQFAEAFNNRGLIWQEEDNFDAALADFNQAIKFRPRYPAALTNRAFLYQERAEWSKAIADYAAALKMSPDSHPTLNDLAWVLATCPEASIRNGKFAVQYAERACVLTQNSDPDYLDTLAAAHAEAGDFAKAIETATQALLTADEELTAELNERLALYREGKPYHMPGPPGGDSAPDAPMPPQ